MWTGKATRKRDTNVIRSLKGPFLPRKYTTITRSLSRNVSITSSGTNLAIEVSYQQIIRQMRCSDQWLADESNRDRILLTDHGGRQARSNLEEKGTTTSRHRRNNGLILVIQTTQKRPKQLQAATSFYQNNLQQPKIRRFISKCLINSLIINPLIAINKR